MRSFSLKICIFAFLVCFTIAEKKPVDARKTKLCLDPGCLGVLFKSKTTREMPSNHPMFLNVVNNMVLNIVGIKFSDRLDIMEALTEEGIRGTFYSTAIDKGAYVEFLRDAVTNKRTMYLISQDPYDVGDKRIVGTLQADKDLVRTYNVEARNYALQQGMPAPEEIPIPTEGPAGHGHSHGGHGHSHGGNEHSNEDGHGHAHSQPVVQKTVEPVIANSQPVAEATTPTPVTLPPVVPQAAAPVQVENTPTIQAAPAVPQASILPVAAAVPLATEAPAANTNVPPVDLPIVNEPSTIIEPPKKMTIEEMQAEIEKLESEDKKKQAEALAAAEQLKQATPPPVASVDPEMERLMNERKKREAEEQAAIEQLNQTAPPPVPVVEPEMERFLNEEKKKLAEEQAAAEQLRNTAAPPVDPEIERLMNEERIKAEAQAAADQANNAPPPPEPTLSTGDIIGSGIPPKIIQDIPTTTPSPSVEEVAPAPVEATPPVPEPVVQTPTEAPVVLETHTNHHHHQNAHVHHPTSEEVTTTPAPVIEEPTTFVPEDPKPTIAEEGFCHSDDCENYKKQESVPVEDLRSVPVYTTTTPPPEIAVDPFKANPFDDNFPSTDSSEFVEQLSVSGRRPAKPSMIGNVFNTVANFARQYCPLDDLSDAGIAVVLNVLIVIALVAIHLIGKLMPDSDDSHRDSRISHDLTTIIKRLELELRQKNEEVRRLTENAGRHQADAQEYNNVCNELATERHENQQYATRLEQANADLQRERKEREAYENTQDALREKMNEAEMRAKDYERKLGECEHNLDHITKELVSTKSALDRFESDLKNERRKTVDYESQVVRLQETIDKLQDDVTEKDSRIVDLDEKNRDMTSEIEQLTKMMIESQIPAMSQTSETVKASPQEESNGSSGWSDFGDDVTEEATPEEKKKTIVAAETVDIREVAKARAQISKLELDFNKAKEELSRQLEDNKKLTESIEKINSELSKKSKECEDKDIQLRQSWEDSKSSNQKNEEKRNENEKLVNALHDEIRTLHIEIKKLSDEIYSWKDQLSAAREEKRNKEDRIKEVESELKQERTRAEKLEHRNFHAVRELQKQLDLTKQAVQQQAPVNSYDPLNMSSGSVDRAGAASRGPQMPEIESLWDEPVAAAHGRRTMSPFSNDEDMFSGPGITPVVKSKSRSSRKSDRGLREPSPSDLEKRKEKKDNVARRRSRSQGRQHYMGEMGAMPPYMPGGPGYPPMYENYHDPRYMGMSFEQSKRHSRSGHQLYYSSGGSNGGRSPPPEMPLISAVPPPGAQRPSSKKVREMPPNFK